MVMLSWAWSVGVGLVVGSNTTTITITSQWARLINQLSVQIDGGLPPLYAAKISLAFHCSGIRFH
jgi:hypothetical protein